jgi:hypothetical protein
MKLPIHILSLVLLLPAGVYGAEAPPTAAAKSKASGVSTMAGDKTRVMRATARAEIAEPGGIYGWMAFTDPATGAHWAPSAEGSSRIHGYPMSMDISFRSVESGREHIITLYGASHFRADHTRRAWHYAISFDHETTWVGSPTLAGDTIKYSPSLWRFNGIARNPRFRHATVIDRPESGGQILDVHWEATFEQRGSPIPDLPDIPVMPAP